LREIRDGDLAAWDEIIHRYKKIVFTTVRSFRLHDADALDAVWITWLRLAENADQVQFPERLDRWLATTARRECLRIRRQAKSGPTITNTTPETTADPSAYPKPSTTDLAQTLQKPDDEEVSEGPDVAGMSKATTTKVRSNGSNFQKPELLEAIGMTRWMARHPNRTNCKCDTTLNTGFTTYICAKCGGRKV
jgi:DNA-directed RNA polymerase specialized sigma24 family protein